MRVLVTGGAGYIGSVMVRKLLREGHSVKVLDSLRFGAQPLLGLWGQPGFQFQRGDIRDRGTIEAAVHGVDAVIHLAAIVGAPACAREPELAQEVNVGGTIGLIEACRRVGVERFIFASTCNRRRAGLGARAMDSSPLSIYMRSKMTVEDYLLGTSGSGSTATTILRFATAFGISPRMRFDLAVNGYTRELLLHRRLMVHGRRFWRPYVHLDDAVRATSLVLEADADKVQDRVFSVGDDGQQFKKEALVEMVRQEMPHQVEVEFIEREEESRNYRVSFRRIRQVLGFEISKTVQDGIQEVRDALVRGAFGERKTAVQVA